jgi:hypothetical protein
MTKINVNITFCHYEFVLKNVFKIGTAEVERNY